MIHDSPISFLILSCDLHFVIPLLAFSSCFSSALLFFLRLSRGRSTSILRPLLYLTYHFSSFFSSTSLLRSHFSAKLMRCRIDSDDYLASGRSPWLITQRASANVQIFTEHSTVIDGALPCSFIVCRIWRPHGPLFLRTTPTRESHSGTIPFDV